MNIYVILLILGVLVSVNFGTVAFADQYGVTPIPMDDGTLKYVGRTFTVIAYPDGQTHKWTSADTRMVDYYDSNNNPVYVDFKTREDSQKVYFESELITIIFDKNTNTLERYEGGKLTGTEAKSRLSHTIKEAVNGTDIWYPILEGITPTTQTTVNTGGIQIVSTKGNFKTIYDITPVGFEYTYEYKNTNPAKNDHKYGFTTVCDGCENIIVDKSVIEVGQTKLKNDLKNKSIKINNDDFDLKEKQHNYTWALKYPEPKKLVIDFTNAKGRLNIGDTLTVDPSFTTTGTNIDGFVGTTLVGTSCSDTYSYGSAVSQLEIYLAISANGECERAYMEFNISGIPNGVTITNSSLQLTQYTATNPANCDITATPIKFSTTTGQQIWNAIANGTSLLANNSWCTTVGSKNLDLGASADAYIQARIVSDDFASIGIKYTTETKGAAARNDAWRSSEYATSSQRPTMTITYTVLPAAPSALLCTSNPYYYGCSWTAINATDVTNYYIAYSPNNSTWSGSNERSVGGNVTSYNFTGFGINEYNYIRVKAFNIGNGTPSNVYYAHTDNIPDAPTITMAPASDTQINITRTAGASDGGDAVIKYDLRCEINDTGGWLSTVTNGTITNYYNYTGLTQGDDLTCQWRDRNGVGYSSWSANATATTYEDIAGSIVLAISNLGDAINATGTITLTVGSPETFTLEILEIIANGTSVKSTTPETPLSLGTLVLNPVWWQIPDGDLRQYTLNATVTNDVYTQEFQSNTINLTREYAPDYQPAIDPTQGLVNYTIARSTDQDTILLNVNRDEGGDTFQIECRYRTTIQASLNEDGVWHNYTDIGYMEDDLDGAVGNYYYIDCYNDALLFQVVSYTNSSMLLAGIEIFDDTYGTFIGVPVGVFFVVLVAGMANQRTAPMWIVVILAIAGIMSAIGFFTLETNVWALALIAALLGIIVGRKLF